MYDYEDQQPDELSLLRGDIIKVYRKMADGTSNDNQPWVTNSINARSRHPRSTACLLLIV